MKCIPVLRSKVPNSTLVGYVSTLYGERTAEEVVGVSGLGKSVTTKR